MFSVLNAKGHSVVAVMDEFRFYISKV